MLLACRPALRELSEGYPPPALTLVLREVHILLGLCSNQAPSKVSCPLSCYEAKHMLSSCLRSNLRAGTCHYWALRAGPWYMLTVSCIESDHGCHVLL